ncbi:MAG: hypothetical protein ACE5JL_14310, partial [Dehalococcoidia bacterium]
MTRNPRGADRLRAGPVGATSLFAEFYPPNSRVGRQRVASRVFARGLSVCAPVPSLFERHKRPVGSGVSFLHVSGDAIVRVIEGCEL